MFVCTWKIEFFGFAFHLTLKRSLWPWNYFTFLFSLQTIFRPSFKRAEREREREREREWARIDRAPIRKPQTELQSDDPHRADRTSFVDRSTAPIAPVSSITALRRSSKDRLQRRTISPSSCDLAFASAARSCL